MQELRSINNDKNSYQRLITFYNEHKDKYFETIPVVFRQWFAANMCSALGGLFDKLSANFNDIKIEHIDPAIETILQKNEFLSYFGHQRIEDNFRTTIKFLKLKTTDGKFFNEYVVNDLLSRNEFPHISHMVKEKMAESIYEMFVNAQIHSETEYIYTCGQFYPRDNKIEFTITDTGIGFKNKINRRFGSNLDSATAIRWATQDKHTTKEGISGGIGLALLKEFILKNKGKMQIISDDGFYQLDHTGEQSSLFVGSFPGTIVNLQFKTDDTSSYHLISEVDLNDIF
jgi:anti-sigma regulatory factor (Ser/Thr protein kinase)